VSGQHPKIIACFTDVGICHGFCGPKFLKYQEDLSVFQMPDMVNMFGSPQAASGFFAFDITS
jgi:hypothetical protein